MALNTELPPLVELGDLSVDYRVSWTSGVTRNVMDVMRSGEYKVSAHMNPQYPECVETLFIIHSECDPEFATRLVENGTMWIHMHGTYNLGGVLQLSNRRSVDRDAIAYRNYVQNMPPTSIIGAVQITPSLIAAQMLSGSYAYGMTAVLPLNRDSARDIIGLCLTRFGSYAAEHQPGDIEVSQALRGHAVYSQFF